MKNGYYLELDELLEDDNNANFGFLENISHSSKMNAYNYLHGYCDDFAMALSEAFGYEIETVHNGDGKLIHAYCVDNTCGKTVYIDIRGITSDLKLFYEEFENELTYYSGGIIVYDEEGYEVDAKIYRYSSAIEYLEEGPGLVLDDKTKLSDILSEANEFIIYSKKYYDVNFFANEKEYKNINELISDAKNRTIAYEKTNCSGTLNLTQDIDRSNL